MRIKKLTEFLETSFRNNRRVLVKGRPGVGKSDIVAQSCASIGAEMVLMHPSISDPTDYKGMPALLPDGTAHFLPFSELVKLINAQKKTICFLDDIGQAAPAVQAALMQLILARSVNGSRISDTVVFCGATNDTSHCSGVSGMIEPLKSRWDTIIELEISADDWSNWALANSMPAELVAFIRFRPNLLCPDDWKPSKEIKNSPCPRTWASIGNWLSNGVKDLEVFSGAVGEGSATEFFSFLDMYQSLPSLDAILIDPVSTEVPEKPAALFAVSTGLARKASASNLDRVTTYLNRLPKEFEIMSMRDAIRINKSLTSTPSFTIWAVKNSGVLI